MNRLQIFKPGRHTALNGKVIDFNESILAATAAAYDPGKHEAPLVIGHPKTDAPAYGWTRSLAFADGVLGAEPHQVEPQFAEMVNAGRFKKLSATFYEPDAPANPVPGVYYLKHIGFLGAAAPSVKGLRSAAFAENEPGVIEFGDWSDSVVASLFRGVRDWIISKFGKDEADKVLPDYSITALTERAAQDPAPSISYSEPDMETAEQRTAREAREAKLKTDQEQLAKDRAAVAAQAASFAELEKAIQAAETAQRRTEIATFVEALVKEGRVLPALKDGLVAYMAGPNEAGVIEFAEAGAQKSAKPGEWLRDYLSKQPKIVEFAEIGKRGVEGVDLADANAIAKAALEYQETEKKAGRTLTVTQAVTHITKGARK